MRTKSNETWRRIIDAAYESFWRSGYTRTNVDSIAARAGVIYLVRASLDEGCLPEAS